MCLYGHASALLSGHTQEHPKLPLGPVALAGSVVGRSLHGLEYVEFLGYRAESGVVLNPLNPYVQLS